MERTEKRRIEAEALLPFIEELERLLPVETINTLLTLANKKEAFTRGKSLLANKTSDTIETLFKDVNTWGNDENMKITFMEKTKTALSFYVTKCPYQTLYKELGIERYGNALSCCRDKSFASGLNENLKLRRTKTLMKGDECCDFRYTIEVHTE